MKILGIETYSGPGHAVWALGFAVVTAAAAAITGLPHPWWLGAAYGTAFYHGREQRDAETRLGVVGKILAPWKWHTKSQWDFWVPAAACLFAAVLAEFLL